MNKEEKKDVRCPMCNRLPMKLVPLYDHDNAHKLQLCCVDCKRKIRKGEKIVKWVGR